ncbi:GntR family transcriptional regulator [Microbaculum marinum]|uniref:GntR family transcriptional regulator n=1 Tax=Microbaculum marinum TaxID=1764581 RepID=A0AAW9RNL9_9HYPH
MSLEGVGQELPGETAPNAPGRQSDQAFSQIHHAIVRCELAPGETITEASLAERFGLKRAAARAAVDRLSVMGLLAPVRRRGYLVKPITLRDVNDLYQLREVIESAAVRLAAGHVNEDHLRRLARVCTAGYEPGDPESIARFLQANTEFHLVIASAAGNERMVNVLAQILNEMERLFHFGLPRRDRTAELRERHQAMIDALAAGDADTAERINREGLARSKAMVVDALMSTDAMLDVSIGGEAVRR